MSADFASVESDTVESDTVESDTVESDTTAGTLLRRYAALAMAATLLVSLPLAYLLERPWEVALIVAAVVIPCVALTALTLWVFRRTRLPEVAIVLALSVVLGAGAGLVLFSPVSYGAFGVVMCVPIAFITAAVGLLLERTVLRYPRVVTWTLWPGVFILLACGVMSVTVSP